MAAEGHLATEDQTMLPAENGIMICTREETEIQTMEGKLKEVN